MIWNKAAECMNEEDKEEIQLSLLQKTLKFATGLAFLNIILKVTFKISIF